MHHSTPLCNRLRNPGPRPTPYNCPHDPRPHDPAHLPHRPGAAPAALRPLFERADAAMVGDELPGPTLFGNQVRALAHHPALLEALTGIYQAFADSPSVERRLVELGILIASRVNACRYCVQHHAPLAHRAGLGREQLEAIQEGTWNECRELWSELEWLLIRYAEQLTREPSRIDDELFAELKRHFSDRQLVDLTMRLALCSAWNKFNDALRLDTESPVRHAFAELTLEVGSVSRPPTEGLPPWLRTALDRAVEALRRTDGAAAAARAERLLQDHPSTPVDQLASHVIGRASRRSAAIGAATSSAALFPGAGTLVSLTLGLAADLTATARLQAEMVIELAALRRVPLADEELRRLLLAVTGLTAGGSAVAGRAGRILSARFGERLARRGLARAIPVVGVAAASGGNALATYLLGRRTDRYLQLRVVEVEPVMPLGALPDESGASR